MKQEELLVLQIRGLITTLPTEHQAKVHELAEQMRTMLRENPELGPVAFSLVGAELQAQA